jgi:hypothetical protein
MGAQMSTRTYKIADQKTVEAKFDDACEEARYEYGHGGYTGTIAEFGAIGSWKDLLLPSANEAEDYIDENHEKWDDAMAVSFKTEDGSFGWVVGGWVSE